MVSSKLAVKGFNFLVRNGKGEIVESLLRLRSGKSFKINTKDLGWIRPDGQINFQTEESALTYLKNRLQDALKGKPEEQFERVIVKKGTTILGQGDGAHSSAGSVLQNISGMLERAGQDVPRDIEVWHSHPDMFGKGRSTPLSGPFLGDIGTFNNLKLKKIVAMNSNGEINSIEATKDLTPEKFKAFSDDFDDFVGSKMLPNRKWERYKELGEISTKYRERGEAVPGNIIAEKKALSVLMRDSSKKIESTEEIALIEHEFYTKASQYGMKYFTNFSNLLKNLFKK